MEVSYHLYCGYQMFLTSDKGLLLHSLRSRNRRKTQFKVSCHAQALNKAEKGYCNSDLYCKVYRSHDTRRNEAVGSSTWQYSVRLKSTEAPAVEPFHRTYDLCLLKECILLFAKFLVRSYCGQYVRVCVSVCVCI